jgi:flagellar basal-body rod protein FlgC
MSSVSAIALSGLNAATLRVQSSASNMANMDDTAPLPGSGVAGPAPYAPTRVSTVSLGANGVQAQLSQAPTTGATAYAPSSPYSDKSGLVATSGVDPATEVVDQAQALVQFKASVALLKVDDEMQKTTLNILG